VALEQVFLRVLRFHLPVAPQSLSSIIWGWYNRPVVAAVPSELSLTPLGIIIIKKIISKDRHRVYIGSYVIHFAPPRTPCCSLTV
jgi:hypothetical protein